MDKIRFIKNPSSIYAVELSTVSEHVVSLTFLNAGISAYVADGFELINENNGKVMGSFRDYTTVYREYPDKVNVIELSNDGSIYVEPVVPTPVVTFTAEVGGKLEGETVQEVEDYASLVIPTVIPDENYKFLAWNPEIPVEGDINGDQYFTATFEYIETLDEVKTKKVNEMNLEQQKVIRAGTDVTLADGTIEHFTLTQNDQISLMNLYTQVQMGIEQIPWHNSNHDEANKYYSNADMKTICDTAMEFVSFHVTLFRDIRIWINSMLTKEEVEKVKYTLPPEEFQSDVLKDLLNKYQVPEPAKVVTPEEKVEEVK